MDTKINPTVEAKTELSEEYKKLLQSYAKKKAQVANIKKSKGNVREGESKESVGVNTVNGVEKGNGKGRKAPERSGTRGVGTKRECTPKYYTDGEISAIREKIPDIREDFLVERLPRSVVLNDVEKKLRLKVQRIRQNYRKSTRSCDVKSNETPREDEIREVREVCETECDFEEEDN
jgi:hypothetical protein